MDEYDIENNEFYDLNRSLRNQVSGLIRDYSKLKNIIRTSETASKKLSNNLKPLENKLNGLHSVTNKLLTSIAGSISGSGKKDFLNGVLSKFLAGSRATGGNVVQGAPYMVGERGPEIFMPSTSGNIISNNSLKKNSRPINVTLNVSTPDIASFQKSESQIIAKLSKSFKRIGG